MAKSNIIQLDANSLTLGEQEADVYTRLKATFRDVALFGGCLREQYIRQNTHHNAPTRDIDVRVRHALHGIPKSIEAFLNSLPLNAWTNLSTQQKGSFSDWIGLDISQVRNRTDRWSLETAGYDKHGNHPVDISMMKPSDDYEQLDHSILKDLRVPFSSVTYSDNGFSAHKYFPRDTLGMQFSISRKDGIRPILWDAFYFNKLKAKYPELKIANPEVPFLLLAHKLKSFLQGHSEEKPSKDLEVARTFAP